MYQIAEIEPEKLYVYRIYDQHGDICAEAEVAAEGPIDAAEAMLRDTQAHHVFLWVERHLEALGVELRQLAEARGGDSKAIRSIAWRLA